MSRPGKFRLCILDEPVEVQIGVGFGQLLQHRQELILHHAAAVQLQLHGAVLVVVGGE